MITVSADFNTIRNKEHPETVIKRITLIEYNVDGVELVHYDIASSLIKGLPEIKKELGEKLNKTMADSISLSFFDDANTIYDILMKSDRYLGLKVELTFDKPNLATADDAATGDQPECLAFSPDGENLFVGCLGSPFKLQKFSVDSVGTLTFVSEVNTAEAFYDLVVTDDYIYSGKASGSFRIYDYDLTELGTTAAQSNARVFVSDDELHCWAADPWNNKVHYFDISDKTTLPVRVEAVTSIDAYDVVYFDEKIFVIDDATEKLKIYDASTPDSVPYALLKELALSSTNPREIYLDSERAILYICGGALEIVDISDTSNPVITAYSATEGDYGNPVVKEGLFMYAHKPNVKIYTIDLINHYLIKNYGEVAVSGTTGKELAWNNHNVLAYCDRDNDIVYTVTVRKDWIPYFEGLVEFETINKEGRNITYFTAISAEKELEKYSAEGVCDTDIDPLAGSGLNFVSADGGFCGVHEVKYIKQNSSHYLQYDNGKEEEFTGTGNVILLDEAEQQEVVINVNSMSDLPDETTEYIIVLKHIDGDSWASGDVGYWYEYMSIEDMIGLLLDESVFTISDRSIRVTE